MRTTMTVPFRHLSILAFLLAAQAAHAAVDMLLTPVTQKRASGQFVDVTLSVRSNTPSFEAFSAIDAILIWNPAHLEFVSYSVTGAGYSWFVHGFLSNPDGLNTTLTDGDGMFTVFASPGVPAQAPPAPGVLVVATFRFRALAGTPATTVSLQPSFGQFSRTRVLGTAPGTEVTGDISSTATVTIIQPCGPTVGDVDGDTLITAADLQAAVLVYLGIDTNPAHIVAADANCDGLANGADIQLLFDYVSLFI